MDKKQTETPSTIVSFVSSGPGDPGLLTLNAVNRLKRADAVLFDDLSAGPILSYARKGADLVGVGKRAGRPSPKQSNVSRLLVDYAKQGGRIVRLKSGDSGIFGRLEEEIIALRQAGIPYEIIAGVPSACAAAAAAGIPLTRRLTARRVQFITGHDVDGQLPEDMNIAALSDASATTVLFMGKRTFARLAGLLIDSGLSPDTPAILAEAVSSPDQRLISMSMAELAVFLESHASAQPALIFYGALSGLVSDDVAIFQPGSAAKDTQKADR